MTRIPELSELLPIVANAGEAAMRMQKDIPHWIKDDGTPVSDADIATEKILLEGLAQFGIPVIAEESRDADLPVPGLVWLLDPIDGTKEFIAGNDDWSVMLGLLKDGEPILSVVGAPARGVMYAAARGKGVHAYEGGDVRTLLIAPAPDPIRFLVSKHHYSPLMHALTEKLHASETSMGSIGVKSAAIAENRGDLQLTDGPHFGWDACAPQLLIEEAGGAVSDVYGEKLSYKHPALPFQNGFLAGGKEAHARALTALQNLL